jgi:O-antigen/teichoic acid export membrane protein
VQTLTLAVVPICILQILLARPLITAIFHERWAPSIPVVQWLSIGLLTQPLSILASALLLARGQFRLLATISAGGALSVIAAAAIGAQMGEQAEIARWTALWLLAVNLGVAWFAFRPMRQPFFPILKAIALPVLLSGFAGAAGWWATNELQSLDPLPRVVVVSVIFIGVYSLLVRAFLADIAQNVLSRFFVKPGAANQYLL